MCGVCPVLKSGDGNCKNCTPLKTGMVITANLIFASISVVTAECNNSHFFSLFATMHTCIHLLQLQWPDSPSTGSMEGIVDIDHWWTYLEEKVVEAVIFKATEMVPIMAASIAPWIAPCAGGLVTYNTECLKGTRP